MKKRKKFIFNLIVIISIYVFMSLNLSPASGQLTFQVPVELKNIHKDLKNWRVNILIYYIVPNMGGAINGVASSNFSVDRNYTGLITVKVNVPDISKAESYIAKLEIKNPKNSQWIEAQTLFNQNSEYNLDPSKPFKWKLDKKI